MSERNVFRPTSICIKRVHRSVTRDLIAKTFIKLFEQGFDHNGANFACTTNGKSPIEKIDMVPRFDYRTQEKFWLVFISFNNNLLVGREEPNGGAYLTKAYLLSYDLNDPNVDDVGVEYCEPYFFRCVKNTSKNNSCTGNVWPVQNTEILNYAIKSKLLTHGPTMCGQS